MCLPFYVYSLNLCHYRCLLCGAKLAKPPPRPALLCSALFRSCHNAGASEPSSVCVQQRISMRSAPAVAMAMDVAVAVATAGAVAVAVAVRLSLPRNPR